MKTGLFLDDERLVSDVSWISYPEENINWTIVRCYRSFKEEVENQIYDYYSFDHDIDDYDDLLKERTGYDCLKFLVEHLIETEQPIKNIQCFFHTQNPIGKKNMSSYWYNFNQYLEGTLYE